MSTNSQIPASLSLDGLGPDARSAFDLASSAGYSGIAIPTNHPELAPDQLSGTAQRHVQRILAHKGLRLDSLRIAAPRTSLTDPATIDRTLDNARRAITLARTLGAPTLSLYIGSLTDSKIPDSSLISALRELAQQADAAGLNLALGADVTGKLATLLHAVDFDQARIHFDGAKQIAAGENPLTLASDYAGHIGQFTASDALRAGNALRIVELGQGQLPLAQILHTLQEQNFRGPTIIDVRDIANPQAAAVHAADALRRALQR